MNNWIELSADRLTANFDAIQQQVGPATTILAVIKANAYGHGAETCAPILVRAGARWLGVTCAQEGARIRHTLDRAGLTAEILIMSGFLPEDAPVIHRHRLTPVLWTPEHVAWLSAYPGTNVHVEVDTGMGRQGVTPGAALHALLPLLTAAQLVPDGIFTHFCSSEVAESPLTAQQQQRFTGVLQSLPFRPTWVHAANSSAVDNPRNPGWLAEAAAHLGARLLVRPGLALFGYALGLEGSATPYLRGSLAPVLTWKARVLATRTLAPGETVGYNATFTALSAMRVALIPAGYADGLRRELSSRPDGSGGWVILAGHRAPTLGRISMNLTVVDITTIPGIEPGDEAILLGEGITADDHAALARTIPYEILCGIHPCN